MIPQNEEHDVIYQNLAQFGSIWHDLAQLNNNVTSRQQGDCRQTAGRQLPSCIALYSVFLRNFFETSRRPPKPGGRVSDRKDHNFRSQDEEIAKPSRRISEAQSKK